MENLTRQGIHFECFFDFIMSLIYDSLLIISFMLYW